MKNVFKYLLLVSVVVAAAACGNQRELNTHVSNTTGWRYSDPQGPAFQAKAGVGNVNPLGMVPIQGGTFTVGEKDEFLTAPRNNETRSLTVSSFYMDKYEVNNLNWNEYLHWLEFVFGDVAPELVQKAMPDHTVWRSDLAYNDPYEDNYFEHPAFSFYPVVGVTWEQAMAYCQWRTDRVNEMTLVRIGAMEMLNYQSELAPIEEEEEKDLWEQEHGYQMHAKEEVRRVMNDEGEEEDQTVTIYYPPFEWIRDKFVFNTEKYLLDPNYNPQLGRRPFLDSRGNERKVKSWDGVFITGYRLPTEAEWEFAAYAPVAGEDGLTIEGKIYPWSGYHPRDMSKKNAGQLQANFIRGRGDMMGVSGALNDRYVIAGPVDAFAPNDFGLYNMAGNVNEWVMDVFRETTFQEASEYNTYRGNIYSHPVLDEKGNFQMDSLGCVLISWGKEDDKRDVLDGDFASLIVTDYPLDPVAMANLMAIQAAASSGAGAAAEEDEETEEEATPSEDEEQTEDDEEVSEDEDEEGGVTAAPLRKVDPTDILAPRVTKKSRVYKGGSWNDRIYWINPSTRRYLDQDKCSSTIGFRCAMSTLGDQIPGTPVKR